MRKVREILRLHNAAGLSGRAIARSLKISPVTVRRYVSRAEEEGLGWPLPKSLDDAELERRLFPAPAPTCSPRPPPDWTEVHRELPRKDVTLALLWEEYKAAHPQGLPYSRFCERYRAWASTLDAVMRQEHRAGEKMFVDYAGLTVPVVERETGRPSSEGGRGGGNATRFGVAVQCRSGWAGDRARWRPIGHAAPWRDSARRAGARWTRDRIGVRWCNAPHAQGRSISVRAEWKITDSVVIPKVTSNLIILYFYTIKQ